MLVDATFNTVFVSYHLHHHPVQGSQLNALHLFFSFLGSFISQLGKNVLNLSEPVESLLVYVVINGHFNNRRNTAEPFLLMCVLNSVGTHGTLSV